MHKFGSVLELALNSILVVFIVCSSGTKCEDNVFRIRKCCAENELMLELNEQCSEYKLLKISNNFYRHVNGSDDESHNGFKDSWPWWFPPETEIRSKKDNKSLSEFPQKYELIAGEGQPCGEFETSYLPAYFYKYTFYDDGSMLVQPKDEDDYYGFNSKILFDPLSFCVDRLELDVSVSNEENEPVLDLSDSVDYVVKLCPCQKATCLLKCCQPGMLLDMQSEEYSNTCVRNKKDDWTPVYVNEDKSGPTYFLLHGMPECETGESLVVPNYSNSAEPEYRIFSNGSARLEGETFISEPLKFCGENIIDGVDKKIHNRIIRCYPKHGIGGQWFEVRRVLYGWLFVIGAVFLFLTLVIHSSLPSLKKTNDKSLICQTWSLLIGYVAVAISQLAIEWIPLGFCTVLGFIIQYCFLSAFFWLNVLCFDISYTFSSLRIASGAYIRQTRKKEIFYFLYGWICPGIIVFVTILIEYYPGIPDVFLKPEIRERCWFKRGSLAQLAYFYGPIATLLAINLLLFLYTSFKIMQTQNDISMTLKNKNPEKQRFLLYLKLFILMGLSWITELISWAVGGPEYYWFIPDTVNLLRAVFIFVIICCKKQVADELRKKFGLTRDSNIRRPSNTRSSSILGTSQFTESYKFSNNADSSL